MKHLKLFFALFAMLAFGVGNAWGANYEIVAKKGSGDGSSLSTSTKVTDVFSNDTYVAKFTTATRSYYNGSDGLKLGASSNAGDLKFTLTDEGKVKATTIIVSAKRYNTSKSVTLQVIAGGVTCTAQTISNSENFTNYTYTINANIADIQLKTSKYCWVESITINYEGGEEPATSLTDDQFAWSAATAEATMGATNTFPTLTNTVPVSVKYESSTPATATIDATSGDITLVAPGTTTISAKFAGGEVNGTKYAAKTVTYTLTVKQLVSCADIYNLADEATFVLKDFVVTYVNGKYTYIKDGTGYGVIYKDNYGLIAGDQVASGKFEGKRDSYKGLVEIIPTTAVDDLHATNGTAPEPELMATNPIAGDMNKYVKFENVSFASTAFSNKYINGTIEGQGSSIKFYDQFATSATFNEGKKYDVIGVVSMFNSVQVNFISAEEVAEPTLNLTTIPIDFGKVAINSTNESTLQLSGSLLTKDITLSVEGDSYFTVSANSITPSEGSVNETITITYKPTVEGTHTATLKITSDDVAEKTITLKGQAVQQHTVHFFVNGEEQNELAKKVLSGNTLEEIPTATSCDLLNYPTFAGWTSAAIDGTTNVKPTMLDLSTTITSDCNYYAVFEKATVSGISEEQTETIDIDNFKDVVNSGGTEAVYQSSSATWTWLKNNATSSINVSYEDIRLYAKHTMTISPKDGCDISKIVVDINNTDKPASNFADGGLSGASMSLKENTATLTPTSGDIVITQNNQSRVNSFVVTYTTSIITYEYITSCAVVVPTCEITYDYAGGAGECTTAIVEEGAEYTLCLTAPTKAGHTFLKWKDQNGTEYETGATINSVTEDLTLTAQWQVNSYAVTWMSLGEEVASNSAYYNTQPTKPAKPTYTCGADKEFVGWTTQEIDGVGFPANLYTDEFPVVIEDITYHAVFASKIEGGGSMSKAVSLTNGETVYFATESGIGVTGANTNNKDATVSTTQGDWMPFTVVTNGSQYQFKNGDNFITAAAKLFKITETPSDFAFEHGYIVYNVPTGADKGDYVLLVNNNNPTQPNYRFYKISNMNNSNYATFYVYKNPTHTDYTTSCPVLNLTEGENTLTNGVTADVKVNRSFTAGQLYTISLPFALNNVSDIFGNVAYEYSSLAKNGDDVILYFSKVNTMETGKPYLIEPTKDVHGFTVENVTLSNTTNTISFSVDATAVSMEAVLSASASATTEGKYWLASDKYLYNNLTTLKSLRALFTISTPSGIAPRVRVALEENGETGFENITDGKNTAIKVIENGQLIIIRYGMKFNAQGQKL